MIVIVTDEDLPGNCEGTAFETIGLRHAEVLHQSVTNRAEDVYFMRGQEVKALKRRNAPLIVPEWLALAVRTNEGAWEH